MTTWWSAPTRRPDTDGCCTSTAARGSGGPVVNCAVMSDAAPSYAPPGRHLLQASALLGPGREHLRGVVRRHAGELLGADPRRGRSWRATRCRTRCRPSRRRTPPAAGRPGRGLYVCGDHRDTGSIQGALVSGRRAAAPSSPRCHDAGGRVRAGGGAHAGFQVTVTVLVYPALVEVGPRRLGHRARPALARIAPLVALVYAALLATGAWLVERADGRAAGSALVVTGGRPASSPRGRGAASTVGCRTPTTTCGAGCWSSTGCGAALRSAGARVAMAAGP